MLVSPVGRRLFKNRRLKTEKIKKKEIVFFFFDSLNTLVSTFVLALNKTHMIMHIYAHICT